VLRHFGGTKTRAVEVYRRFVDAGLGESSQDEYYRASEGRVLGSEEFLEEIRHRVGDPPRAERAFERTSIEDLLNAAERSSGLSRQESTAQAGVWLAFRAIRSVDLSSYRIATTSRVIPPWHPLDRSVRYPKICSSVGATSSHQDRHRRSLLRSESSETLFDFRVSSYPSMVAPWRRYDATDDLCFSLSDDNNS
jgi:hypothetical protein